MRRLLPVCCLTPSLFFALACGDEPPLYPPLPGSATSGGGTDGSVGGTGDGATGSTAGSGGGSNPTGGKNNGGAGKGSAGGSSSAAGGKAGSGTTPDDYCALPWSGDDPPPPSVACDLDALVDGGELKGDITADRALESGKFYTLKGEVRVMPEKTLTIPPCVVVKGADANAILVVMAGPVGDTNCNFAAGTALTPGGKLIAKGEPMAPIIFTSSKPKGSRRPGDWGGMVLLGNARNNLASSTARDKTEGLENLECHGWFNDDYNDDDSGTLEYVRIEYASRQTAANEETNGLTLASLGSGTTINHVMVSNSNDDCFEWFGGTVNVDHLIALNCEDDMYDADRGFTGTAQFLFGRQFPTTGEADSRGFEIDTFGDNKDPLTTARWANFTMCGGGPEDKGMGVRQGIAMRTQAAGSLIDGLITGFSGGGLVVQTGAKTSVTYTTIFDVPSTYGVDHTGGTDWFPKQRGNSLDEPIGFCDCWANPPSAVARDRQDGAAPGFGDTSADYRGAFEDSRPESNWMKGLWVDWSED